MKDAFDKNYGVLVHDSQVKVTCASGMKNGKWKNSYHIVFDIGFCFSSAMQCKRFFTATLPKEMIRDDRAKTGPFDMAVYSRNQDFRLIGNSKMDDERVLVAEDAGVVEEHMVTQFTTFPKLLPMEVIDQVTNNKLQSQSLAVQFEPKEVHALPRGAINHSAIGYLKMLPNEDAAWEAYFAVMCAAKNSGVPFDVFEEWAKISKKYDVVKTKAEWCALTPRENGYNMASLKRWVGQFYPDIILDAKTRLTREILKPTVGFPENIRKVEYDARFIRPIYKYMNEWPHFLVRSHMGTGKTTALNDAIREAAKILGRDPRILVITPRVTLAESMIHALSESVDLELYHDHRKADRKKLEMATCQLESLWTMSGEFDIVIMDECESNLAQFSSDTHKEHFTAVMRKFEEIITNSKWSFWLDVFVSDRSILAMDALCKGAVLYIHNTHQPYERVAHRITAKRVKGTSQYWLDKLAFVEKFVELINEGKRVVVVCGSRAIVQMLEDAMPKGKTIFTLHSKSPDSKKKLVRDVNAEWVKYDAVAYTSSITVGVNFDVDHFDVLMMDFNACSATPRDSMQTTCGCARSPRTRCTTLPTKSYHDDKFNNKFDRDAIREDVLTRVCYGCNLLSHQVQMPEWLEKVWIMNRQENNV